MESPEFFQSGYYDVQFTPEKCLSDAKNGDHFDVEDLLDFPNEDNTVAVDGGLEVVMMNGSSTIAAVENSCNSYFSGGRPPAETHFNSAFGQFSTELCVPCDDVAELEWLSNFVEESFSSVQGTTARNTDTSGNQPYQFQPEITKPDPQLQPAISVPGKARSKRSRAAPGDWASAASRLLAVTPAPPPNVATVSSLSEPEIAAAKKASKPKKENPSCGGEGRRCLHCDIDKTPQWRTGPMGPKTLCNACGVRYKSGRLVPEYRPAASPTFVLSKHSNSHRKVLELRRQKEVQGDNQVQQHQYLHHQII